MFFFWGIKCSIPGNRSKGRFPSLCEQIILYLDRDMTDDGLKTKIMLVMIFIEIILGVLLYTVYKYQDQINYLAKTYL